MVQGGIGPVIDYLLSELGLSLAELQARVAEHAHRLPQAEHVAVVWQTQPSGTLTPEQNGVLLRLLARVAVAVTREQES
jgi:hypothetical protein